MTSVSRNSSQEQYSRLTKDPSIRNRIRDQIQGYQRMNKKIKAEKRRELSRMTTDESRTIFNDLCLAWEHSFEKNPNLGNLENKRIQDLIEYRRLFNLLGTRLSLIA